jgi:hypothetical protein
MHIVKIINEYKVVVDAGKDMVKVGDRLKIIGAKENIINPITGKDLGVLYLSKAKIEVSEVYEKMCVCRPAEVNYEDMEIHKTPLNVSVEKIIFINPVINLLDEVMIDEN